MKSSTRQSAHASGGFTLVELMVIVAVIAILATIALPSFLDRIIRNQIVEGVSVADFVRVAVATSYAGTHAMPANNAAAGLPDSSKIVGNYVSDITVNNGAIVITFGNRASASLVAKKLTLRPAVVLDAPMVPIAWVCGNAGVPSRMTALGQNETTVPNGVLPLNCRP